MFKFVHAWWPGESWEPLAADGFVGVEVDGDNPSTNPPAGVPVAGRRPGPLVHAIETNGVTSDLSGYGYGYGAGSAYAVLDFVSDRPVTFAAALREMADENAGVWVLAPNAWSYATAASMWNLLEVTHHPRVGAALDADAALAHGESAAVLVPTLNLRIGLVRVRQIDPEMSDYARRLAGIGFDGYVVTDPPAGPDRPAASLAIAAAFRAVLPPAKPVKKVPAKVAK